VNYQGALIKEGIPVHGARPMRFKIYRHPVSSDSQYLVWDSGERMVEIVRGRFVYVLGEDNREIFSQIAWPQNEYYLEVEVEGKVLTPREKFTSGVYALVAESVDGYRVSLSSAPGKIMVTDSSGRLACSITGDAGSSVGGKRPDNSAGNLPVLDDSGKLSSSVIPYVVKVKQCEYADDAGKLGGFPAKFSGKEQFIPFTDISGKLSVEVIPGVGLADAQTLGGRKAEEFIYNSTMTQVGNFSISGDGVIGGKLRLGSDVVLYRVEADRLKTEDSLDIANNLTVGLDSILAGKVYIGGQGIRYLRDNDEPGNYGTRFSSAVVVDGNLTVSGKVISRGLTFENADTIDNRHASEFIWLSPGVVQEGYLSLNGRAVVGDRIEALGGVWLGGQSMRRVEDNNVVGDYGIRVSTAVIVDGNLSVGGKIVGDGSLLKN
jgi:hypothetical protein